MAHAFYAYSTPWTSYAKEHSSPIPTQQPGRMRRRTLSYRVQVGTATLAITLCVMMAVLMIALLRHANSVATKGYVIRQLSQERTALETQNRVLRQQASELQSLATIKQSPLYSTLIPIENGPVTYVHHRDSVALSDVQRP